jgi:glycosyltransferase involved in cell wall biosynthesis
VKTGAAVRSSGRRLKVLHVINGLARGGAETVLYRLLTTTPDIEHEVICLVGPGWYSDKLQAHGIRVHHLNWTSSLSALTAMRRLHKLIRKSDADLVQAWMYRSNVLAGLFSRMAGKPVVWNVRCSSLGPLRLASRFAARVGGLLAGSHADMVINCSAASADLHAGFGYGRADGIVIPNGYDPGEIAPDDAQRLKTRKALGISPGEFVMGCIARWHRQKGFPVVLQALRLLEQRHVPCRFLLVGNGLDRSNPDLMALVEHHSCAQMVEPIGETSDVPAIARALDLHVLASIGSEGFPNTVAETMLAGTPNVATRVGDAALIIGDTGWIVEPNDAAKLADAIEKAYNEWKSSPDRWQRRRVEVRNRISDEFPLSGMARSYERLWREVADNSQAGGARSKLDPKKPRILHIITGLGPGGAESVLYRLISQSGPARHEVICLERRDWYSGKLEERGVTVRHVNWTKPWLIVPAMFRLGRFIWQSEADLVQTWMYRSNLLGGLLARVFRKPVIWNIRSTSPSARFGSPTIAKIGGKLANWLPEAVINCSGCSAKYHEKLGYRTDHSLVIANGYDPAVFHADETTRELTRKSLGVASDSFLIGAIARWDPLKDIPNLLEAMQILRSRGIPVEALLVGRGLGSNNRELADLVQRCSCKDIVQLLGERPDVPDLARALDLHVLASNSEGFPNAVAETMLSRTPNVVTDVGDAAFIVGDTAWVVPPRDSKKLANAIEEAFNEWKSHPQKWEHRRAQSEQRISENFSLQQMTNHYEELWAKVAAASA